MRWLLASAGLVGLFACGGSRPAVDAPSASLVAIDDHGAALATVELTATSLGTTSEQILHLRNAGDAASGPIDVAASGDFTIDAAATTCASAALAAGATCDVAVVFAPTLTGSRSGTLVITADPGGSLAIVLGATGLEADLALSASTIDLSDVDLGSTASATITVSNSGTGPGTIGNPTITGAGWSLGPSTCTGTLAAGAACTFGVVFAPSVLGPAPGSFTVVLLWTPTSVALTATGTSALTVATSGAGSGTVVSSPTGIACGSTCSSHFSGAVQLDATPAPGSTFAGWSEPSCSTPSCSLPASMVARTVTATFTPQ